MTTKQAYEILLRLYPASYRTLFEREMLSVFHQAADNHRAEGRVAYARFAAVELLGLARGAAMEWAVTIPTPAAASLLTGAFVAGLAHMFLYRWLLVHK